MRRRWAAPLTGLLGVACSAGVDRVVPLPPGRAPLGVIAADLDADTGTTAFAFFDPARPHVWSLPAEPTALEAALFQAERRDLPPLQLAEAPDALLPTRTLTWTGTAWRPTTSPRLLAGVGLAARSADACLLAGGCWPERPPVGRAPCQEPCRLTASPEPPVGPRGLPTFHAATLGALTDEVALRGCRARGGRWDPEDGCVPIGTPGCAPPASAPEVRFVAPAGPWGDGRTATAAMSLASALASDATRVVLLPGEYLGDLEISRSVELVGVCPAEVRLRGEVGIYGADVRLADLRIDGGVRTRAEGGSLTIEDAIVEPTTSSGSSEEHVVAGQHREITIRRSYVGTGDRARWGLDRNASLFLFGNHDARVEASELWGRIGNQCNTNCRQGAALTIAGSVLFGGAARATVTSVAAPPLAITGSILVGGPDAIDLSEGSGELDRVHVVGARGIVLAGARLVGRGVSMELAGPAAALREGAELALSDASLSTSGEVQIDVGRARLELARAVLRGTPERFVFLRDGATAKVEDLEVTVQPPSSRPQGRRRAIEVEPGASLSLTRADISGAIDLGLKVDGTLDAAHLRLTGGERICSLGCDRPLCCDGIGLWAGANSVSRLARALFSGFPRAIELRSYRELRHDRVEMRETPCAMNGTIASFEDLASTSIGAGDLCQEIRAEQ